MPHTYTASDVARGQIKRRIAWDFTESAGLPTGLSSFGAGTTITNHPATANRGELEISVNNDKGGIEWSDAPVSVSDFEEVRIGAHIRGEHTSGNAWELGFQSGSGSTLGTDAGHVFNTGNDAVLVRYYLNAGTATNVNTNIPDPDSVGNVVECRLIPSNEYGNTGFVIGHGGGYGHDPGETTPVGFEDTNANIGLTDMYPKVTLDTTATGTAESIFLGALWIDLIQN